MISHHDFHGLLFRHEVAFDVITPGPRRWNFQAPRDHLQVVLCTKCGFSFHFCRNRPYSVNFGLVIVWAQLSLHKVPLAPGMRFKVYFVELIVGYVFEGFLGGISLALGRLEVYGIHAGVANLAKLAKLSG